MVHCGISLWLSCSVIATELVEGVQTHPPTAPLCHALIAVNVIGLITVSVNSVAKFVAVNMSHARHNSANVGCNLPVF